MKKTAVLVVTTVGVTVGAFFLSPKYGVAVLLLVAAVAALFFILHPKFRYFRLAVSILSIWASARAMPSFSVVAEATPATFRLLFDHALPWSFDCAVALTVVVLLFMDDRLRNGDKVVRRVSEAFSRWAAFNKQTAGDNAVQVQVTNNGNESPVTIHYTTARDDFNALIDVAASFLKVEQPDVTIARLKEIQRHHWDKLSLRERYRVHANLGHAYSRKDMHEEATEQFIKAAIFEPHDEMAMCYLAAGLYAMDEFDKARDKARAVLVLHPFSELASAVLIKTDQSSSSTAELFEQLTPSLRNSVEVLFGLYTRSIRNQEITDAEVYARKIIAAEPTEIRHHEYLGAALAQKAVLARQGVLDLNGEKIDQVLQEADELLSKLIAEDELPCRKTIGRARFHRAIVRSFRNTPDLAENDFREAMRLLPNDRQVGHQFGLFMCKLEKIDEAIRVFEENADEPAPMLMRARLLGQRRGKGDIAVAIHSLELKLSELPNFCERDRFDYAESLCGLYVSNQEHQRAEAFLSAHEHIFGVATYLTLSAEVAFRIGSRESALEKADKASREISQDTPEVSKHFLAHLLAKLGQYADALAVYKEFIKPCAFDVAMHHALECARQAGDHQFILQFCPQLRRTGNATSFTIETEVGALELHSEFDAAIEIIDAYLDNPKDHEFAKTLQVRRSIFGLRLNRPELIETDLEKLPDVATVPARFGCIVASVLAQAGKYTEAATYAYQLFRNHPDESAVHKCLGTLMGIGETEQCPFPDPTVVETDSAVRYRETNSESEKWVVIENEYEPKLSLNEFAPGSFLGKQLVGKSVGEEFSLRKDGIQERKAKITGIVHKFEYRKFDCWQGFENRFHDDFLCMSFQFPTLPDGTPDVASFLDSIKQLNKPIDDLDEFARKSPISVAAYANIAQRSILATVFHFASKSELPIRCCRGTNSEFLRAEAVLGEPATIVVDPTALSTIFAIEAYKLIPELPPGFIVSHGTLDYFRQLVHQPDEVISKRLMVIQKGRMSFISRDGEVRMSPVDEINAFCMWIERNFKIKGGRGTAEIPISKRKELEAMFGSATVESVGLAYVESAVLWTDDFAVAELIQEELVSHRIWTDVLAEHFQETGLITRSELQKIKIRLIELGCTFTRLTFDSAETALRTSNWDCQSAPLPSVLDWLNKSGVHALGAIQHAAHILRYTWQNAPLAHQRMLISDDVARSLSQRSDGQEVLNRLNSILERIFPVDVLAKAECRASIKKHGRLTSRDRVLILPDDPAWHL